MKMTMFKQQQSIEVQFCTTVNSALRARDGTQLKEVILLEPPFPDIYQRLIASLESKYPQTDTSSEERLEILIRASVLETGITDDGPGWNPMVTFLAAWMSFIRDVNIENLLETYQRLSELQQKANSALQHPTKGVIVLPTLIAYAKVLSRVAIGLDKRPELIQHLIASTVTEEGRRESLPEKAANILRAGFNICLNDRNTAPGGVRDGKPDGKKVGIYKMANLCLRILFQAEKLDNCKMIFDNIQNSSPPLHIYPKSERVTYLYFMGRYQFAQSDYYAAQACLQTAYKDCMGSAQAISQRRLILIYLIAANILLGRFPTEYLYQQPEARGLRERFQPLTRAIRKGDLEAFRRMMNLDLTDQHAIWFSRYKIFYQLGNICEIYVWRSIFRKAYLLSGRQGAGANAVPSFDLTTVLAAFLFYEKRLNMSASMAHADGGPGRRSMALVLSDFSTPISKGYIDPDFEGLDVTSQPSQTDLLEIEAICGSLITMGLLNGYISRGKSPRNPRFAIQGAKKPGGPLKNGFPNIWEKIKGRSSEQVLGWKKDFGGGGGGGVVRLSNVRPAGE
jgi:tetratricopeptide (TPR) repeat protein